MTYNSTPSLNYLNYLLLKYVIKSQQNLKQQLPLLGRIACTRPIATYVTYTYICVSVYQCICLCVASVGHTGELCKNFYFYFLSTYADRQCVDIYHLLFVFLCVCTVTNFSGKDKASGVKFCTAVHRRPGHTHFGELCSPVPQNGTNRPATGK